MALNIRSLLSRMNGQYLLDTILLHKMGERFDGSTKEVLGRLPWLYWHIFENISFTAIDFIRLIGSNRIITFFSRNVWRYIFFKNWILTVYLFEFSTKDR